LKHQQRVDLISGVTSRITRAGRVIVRLNLHAIPPRVNPIVYARHGRELVR